MRDSLYRLARMVYPGLESFTDAERPAAAGYVLRILVFLPLAIIGLVWLIGVTDWGVLRANALWLLLLLAFMIVLSQLWLQTYYVTESGGYRSDRRSFWGEALWSGVLIWGPSAAWLGVVLPWIVFTLRAREGQRLYRLRLFSTSVFRMVVPLLTLIEAALYERFGGTYPLPGLDLDAVLPAVWATLIGFTLGSAIMGLATGVIRLMSPPSALAQREGTAPLSFWLTVTLLGPFGGLVAILPASMFALAGPGAYFAFVGVLLAATFITDRLSLSIESARRRTRELEHLEHLSRGIIQSPPDNLDLPALLAEHVPHMFPACHLAIRLASGEMLLDHHSAGECSADSPLWTWQPGLTQPAVFRRGEAPPWADSQPRGGLLLAPIVAARGEGGAKHKVRVIGRIYLRSEEHALSIERLVPAAQSLSAQIASVLFSREVYRQTLAERVVRQQLDRELALGAKIQASFLPPEVPTVEGWEIAATLEPARETSGDFFDFIPLNEGRIGLVVADVADKGLGAAFYMALTCTLLRTYAFESSLRYPKSYLHRIGEVVETVNARLMGDTSGDTFVTLFYGILDPRTSTLCYANAGHNPPFLFHRDRRRRLKSLTRTGPALGLLEGFKWKRRTVRIEEGDVLLLYTDGLTEAEDLSHSQFEEARVQQVVRDNLHQPVNHLCDAILASVYDFAGGAPRSDDITLMLLRRNSTPGDGKWAIR